MARTDRTKPVAEEVGRSAVGKMRSRAAGASLIRRMRAEQMASKPKKAGKLMGQYKELVGFESTLPSASIGRVKREKKRNPFGGL